MFRPKCPKCQANLIGTKFEAKGRTTWEQICQLNGMKEPFPPPPPGARKFYAAILVCPKCGSRMADFPIMLKDGYLQWTERVKKYEASEVLTQEMLEENGPRTEIEHRPGFRPDGSNPSGWETRN